MIPRTMKDRGQTVKQLVDYLGASEQNKTKIIKPAAPKQPSHPQ